MDASISNMSSFGHILFTNSSLDIHSLLLNFTAIEPAEAPLDVIDEKPWRIAVITLWSFVLLFAFLGNLAMLCMLMSSSKLRTPTNTFIMTLNICDILQCCLCQPIVLHNQLEREWIFGRVLCTIVMTTLNIPIYVSSMAMFLLAIDRYIVIVQPLKKRMSTLEAVLVTLSFAGYTLVVASPIFQHTEHVTMDMPGLNLHETYCIEDWSDHHAQHVYTVASIVYQFALPLFAAFLLYLRICCVLVSRPLLENDSKREEKTNMALMAIWALFTAGWLPWFAFPIIMQFGPIINSQYFSLVAVFLRLFAMCTACVRPFVYGCLHNNFRNALDSILKRPSSNTTEAE